MRSIRIESGNGRSISEELETAMNLLDGATISYRVNVLVADADEDAASFAFHGARIKFTAGSGTIPIESRSDLSVTLEMSVPSIKIRPAASS